TNRNFLRF
uniref:FMRFamide-like neuropeptide 4 n=1 Tax=Homarus americanus TaxID=6706 RepID=FAR4_HOMAM|nr:RecName: Full=FMRFamide-like neuropeptide 4; Short=FLI 4; AltName: Full=F1 [Homarus americanus]prf//1923341B TNRNFLRFamide [Cancer borealis]